jgi:hypothetical protein
MRGGRCNVWDGNVARRPIEIVFYLRDHDEAALSSSVLTGTSTSLPNGFTTSILGATLDVFGMDYHSPYDHITIGASGPQVDTPTSQGHDFPMLATHSYAQEYIEDCLRNSTCNT